MRGAMVWLCLGACTSGVAIGEPRSEGGAGDGGGAGVDHGAAGGGGAPAVVSCKAMLLQAQACMTYDDWQASGIEQVAYAEVDTGQQCRSCHTDGSGFFMSGDPVATFEYYKSGSAHVMHRFVTCTTDDQGDPVTLVPSNAIRDKGALQCLPDTNCHPAYTLALDVEIAVADYVELLLAKWDASDGLCR